MQHTRASRVWRLWAQFAAPQHSIRNGLCLTLAAALGACAPSPTVDWSGVRGWPKGGPTDSAQPGFGLDAGQARLVRGAPPPGRIAGRHEPLECVPFARELSGVDVIGDAWTWWDQAAGRYERGRVPVVGSVLAFRATDVMPLGHVAVVGRVVGSRELLIHHANWDGGLGKGMVDVDARVRDLSARNDWSLVQVWHPGRREWGSGSHAVAGFIYAPVAKSPDRLLIELPGARARAIVEAERLARLDRTGPIERGGRQP